MLDEKKKSKSPSPSSRSRSPFSPPSPTFSRNSSAKHPDDDAFLESTISYLGSPPAKTLGLAIPVRPPPALSSTERTHGAAHDDAVYHEPRRTASTRKPVPKDVPSAISDVLDSPWPIPPSSPTPTGGSTRHSPGHSPTSSAGEKMTTNYVYPSSAMSPTSDISSPSLYSTSTHQPYGERPFEGSGIAVPTPFPAHKVVVKRTSLRSLHRSLSSDFSHRFCPSPSPSGHRDVIHMTVVREMA